MLIINKFQMESKSYFKKPLQLLFGGLCVAGTYEGCSYLFRRYDMKTLLDLAKKHPHHCYGASNSLLCLGLMYKNLPEKDYSSLQLLIGGLWSAGIHGYCKSIYDKMSVKEQIKGTNYEMQKTNMIRFVSKHPGYSFLYVNTAFCMMVMYKNLFI